MRFIHGDTENSGMRQRDRNALNNTQCTVPCVCSQSFALHSTQYTAHSTQHTVDSTQYTVPCVCSQSFALHSTQYTAHSTQHTVHSTQHTAHSTQHTVHSTQYTVHSTLCVQSLCPVRHRLGPASLSVQGGGLTVGPQSSYSSAVCAAWVVLCSSLGASCGVRVHFTRLTVLVCVCGGGGGVGGGKLWCALHVTDCAGLCLWWRGGGASCGVHLT